MKISYDTHADTAYIQLSDIEPDEVVEGPEGITFDMTEDGRLMGIEILEASKKFPIDTLNKFEREMEVKELEEA
ncbi:MAG TPA: DUF2283 domain-containing protein [Candidatus Kapabacteria bacterium]|jgi:uncharacterized protein YuzE